LIPHGFHHEAEEEFTEAASFYESRVPGLGWAFVGEVERAITFARTNPEAGSPLGEKVRRMLVRRFPYSVIYRGEAERLLILAIAHQHRRPGYWRHRT
jgi:plasmid stabilization system protein ParE